MFAMNLRLIKMCVDIAAKYRPLFFCFHADLIRIHLYLHMDEPDILYLVIHVLFFKNSVLKWNKAI